jgi:hypothetical protein
MRSGACAECHKQTQLCDVLTKSGKLGNTRSTCFSSTMAMFEMRCWCTDDGTNDIIRCSYARSCTKSPSYIIKARQIWDLMKDIMKDGDREGIGREWSSKHGEGNRRWCQVWKCDPLSHNIKCESVIPSQTISSVKVWSPLTQYQVWKCDPLSHNAFLKR